MVTKHRVPSFVLAGFVCLALGGTMTAAGCGGGGDSSTSSGTAGDDVCHDYSGFTPQPNVSFKNDILQTFRTSCGLSTSCHATPMNSVKQQQFLGLPMAQGVMTQSQIDEIFTEIISVKAVEVPTMDVVNPGHPETSYMMFKLDAQPTVDLCSSLVCDPNDGIMPGPCGTNMPQSGAQMPVAFRDLVRSWIADGAQNN